MDTEPVHRSHSVGLLAVALAILAAGLPLLIYWAALRRFPSVSTGEARRLIAGPESHAVLVDIRTPAERLAQPLPESVPWPAADIQALRSLAAVPEPLQNRPLLLLCAGGVQSALAVEHLQKLGSAQAASIRGGYQSWIATAAPEVGFRPTAPVEQLALVIAVYPLKLVYMGLAMALVVGLWRRAEAAWVALRWSMLSFWLGELACWVNIVAFNEESTPLEFLHSWGMIVSVSCLAFFAIEALDHGLLHYSEPRRRCAFAGHCSGCAKVQAGPCLVLRLFRWTLPVLALSAAILLAVPSNAVSYNTSLFGVTRNLMHPVLIQVYEGRFAPLAAIVLLIAAWLLLLTGARGLRLSKVCLAAGLGHLSFGFLRLMLFAFFQADLVWFVFWEEATELILVLTIVFGVWAFRPEWVRQSAARITQLVT